MLARNRLTNDEAWAALLEVFGRPPKVVTLAANGDSGIAWLAMHAVAVLWERGRGKKLSSWVLEYAPTRARRMRGWWGGRCGWSVNEEWRGTEVPLRPSMLAVEEPEPTAWEDERRHVERAWRMLTIRDRHILWRRASGESLDSVAQTFQITRERVRQIEERGLKRLRTLSRNGDVDATLSKVLGKATPRRKKLQPA